MKRNISLIVVLLSIVLLSAGSYVAVGPLITLNGIKTAIEENDAEKLKRFIDFEQLRGNLSGQLKSQFREKMEQDGQNSILSAIAISFADSLMDAFVDSFVSPPAISIFMAGKTISDKEETWTTKLAKLQDKSDRLREEQNISLREWLSNARIDYESASRFSIWIDNDQNSETGFVLERKGLVWKLTNIILPD